MFADPYRFDVEPPSEPARDVRSRRAALLSRLVPRPARDPDPPRGDPGAERPLRADRAAGAAQLELHQRLQVDARARRRTRVERRRHGDRRSSTTTSGSFSPESGSRPASRSRCGRPTRARSSRRSPAQVPRRRAGRSTPPSEAMREPLPPWRRAEILERVAQLVRERRRGARAARSAPRPASRSRLPASRRRARSTRTRSRPARPGRLRASRFRSAGTQPGDGHIAWTVRVPIGVDRRDHAVQLPAQPRRPQARAGARGRLRGRPEAGEPDAGLGAPARGALRGGRASRRLAERPPG